MTRPRTPLSRRDRRGSVLVPLVAAMLVLWLTGGALAELFSAQRAQAVAGLDSSRAFWTAEAGLAHAALERAAVVAPVPFAGGSYTVSKAGSDYASTGRFGVARRGVARTWAGAGGGGGGGTGGGGGGATGGDPLDEGASVATLITKGNDKFELDLISDSPIAGILASFSLTADVPTADVDELRLGPEDIWKQGGGVALPTGDLALNEGDLDERTISAGDSPTLRVEFDKKPKGDVTYTLVLLFTDGTSSTLTFTISW